MISTDRRVYTEAHVADAQLLIAARLLGWGPPDSAGCFHIPLGPNTYALVDWDGKFRVGLYGRRQDTDEELGEDGRYISEFDRMDVVLDFLTILLDR